MGNETSAEEGGQFESSDHAEIQGDINDLLGFLSLDQIESPSAENEEENPIIKIPPEPGGKEEDADSDKGSVPKNVETSDTDTTSKDATLNESDDSDDAKLSEARSSPLPVSSVSVSPVSVSPVPVSPVSEAKQDSFTSPKGEEKDQTLSELQVQTNLNGDVPVENDDESNDLFPVLSEIDSSDEIMTPRALTQGEADPVENDVEKDEESSNDALHIPVTAETETAGESISEEVPAPIVEEDNPVENDAGNDEESSNGALHLPTLAEIKPANPFSFLRLPFLAEIETANKSISEVPAPIVEEDESPENDSKNEEESSNGALHTAAQAETETADKLIPEEVPTQIVEDDDPPENDVANDEESSNGALYTPAPAETETTDKSISEKVPAPIVKEVGSPENDAINEDERSNGALHTPAADETETTDKSILEEVPAPLVEEEDSPQNDVENDSGSGSGALHTRALAEIEAASKSILEVPAQIVEDGDTPENDESNDEESNNGTSRSLPLTKSETADSSVPSSTQIESLDEEVKRSTPALTDEAKESSTSQPPEEVAPKENNSSESDEKTDKKIKNVAAHSQALEKVEPIKESISLDGARHQVAQDDKRNLENDQQSKRDSVDTSATHAASASLENLILLKGPRQISRKGKNHPRNNGAAPKAKATKPKPSPEKKVSRKGSQIFSEGSLKGTLEKINENSICRDPLLKAVAAGSAVRKAKREEKMRNARVFSSNNEWRISLGRSARTAASTAKTVASATAPVISDASRVILSSATEFAQDFKDELEKEYQKPSKAEATKNPTINDHRSKELQEIVDSKSDEDQDINNERERDSVNDEDDDSKTEIIMNSMADEEKDSEGKVDDSKDTDDDVSGFFDALEGIGLSFETENSTSQRQRDSFDIDNGSPSPQKCIYEELKDIEENFDAQIKTMLGGDSFTMEDNNDNTDHSFSERTDIDLSERTDNDFSERSAESSFFGRSNFFVKPIITETFSEEKASESSIRNETNFVEEITPRIRNHIDLHENENDKPEDPELIAPAAPQVRTRSGRVVKPVRRLVDGDDTSAWEENRYSSSDKEISIVEEEILSHGESESPNINKANESQLELTEEEPTIEESEDVSTKDESKKESIDVDKLDESQFETTEEEPSIEELEDVAVKDESKASSMDFDKPDESHFEATEEEPKIVETKKVAVKDESKKPSFSWGWGWGNESRSEAIEEEPKIVETKEVDEKDENKKSSMDVDKLDESQLKATEKEPSTEALEDVNMKDESKESSADIDKPHESHVEPAEEESKIVETEEVDETDESKHSTEANESQLKVTEDESKVQNIEAVALGDDESNHSAQAEVAQIEVVEEDRKKEEKEKMTLDSKSEHSPSANEISIGKESLETYKWDEEESVVDQEEPKAHLSDTAKIKASHLFDTNEDLIFESQDTGTMNGDEDDQSTKESEKNQSALKSEKESFMHEESLFKDGKKIVKYVVTKLTGYDIKVTDRIEKSDFHDGALMNDRPIPESVFEKQARDDIEVLSSSSFSSPPEIDIPSQSEDKASQDVDEEMNEFLPIFDFIPAKSEILRSKDTSSGENKGKPNDPKEYLRKRKLFKQTSSRSIKDSLASFSTHEKSSNNSLVFSPSSRRSRRRLRRVGSKMSLSLTNTQSTKSPFETPIDNHSLAGSGKQRIELTSIDHGGQMVGWDTDVEAKFPSVPDTEEMTEALERSELFHDTLASFSSLENIDFLKNFSLRKSSDVPKSLALLLWRQLLANWKHSEACKAMMTRTSSIQLTQSTRHTEIYDFDDSVSSSFSTIRLRLNARELVLPKAFIPNDSYPSLRCSDDDNDLDIIDNGMKFLTRFLCNVGPRLSSSLGGCETASGEPLLRHDFASATENGEKSSAMNITEIQEEAKKLLPTFEILINHIAKFSAQNSSPHFDLEGEDITFSCGVKDYASIRNKAKRKYKGDVSLVKDVLRGQITFPDEGSLICGLCHLYSIAKNGYSGKGIEESQPSVPFQIVRLKNLFRTSGVNDEVSNALPTGYRHVLINIKFDCGIIAEIQYQIAQLFDVIGKEGYKLHQEILSQMNDELDSKLSDDKKIFLGNRNDPQIGVSTSVFVQSVLRTCGEDNDRGVSSANPKEAQLRDKNPNMRTDTKETAKFSVRGIGSLAAQAALKRSEEKSALKEVEISTAPPGGGIAALAAQAATKKSQKKSRMETRSPQPPVGIAALAAQAALKKSQKKTVPPAGGIAALAAQAALKKAQQKESAETPPAQPPAGGIAALAAQAALKKAQQKEADKNESPQPLGIAALAAQAALKKAEEKKADENKNPAPVGIAALAAQAALKKAQEKEHVKTSPAQPPVGIAALAAQAALKRSQEKEVDRNRKPLGGGIAVLAAKAALKKSQEKAKNESQPFSPAGSIAALAAQAALKKSKEKQQNDNASPLAAGGIAALAAQAALQKSEEKEHTQTKPSLPAGGIAALAAQAALKKSKEKQQNDNTSPPAAGGIAALAAQAALKKSKEKQQDDKPPPPAAGGIAALAAQAALKKSEKKEQKGNPSLPGGGIAALAAQAALMKSGNGAKSGVDQNGSDVSGDRSGLKMSFNSMPMLLTAVLETGIIDAISNPRDVPALCCLNMLVTSLQKSNRSSMTAESDKKAISALELSTFARRLLLRSLSISNQATSIGMIGWLEYGSTDLIDRTLNLPLEVLQRLSYNMAAQKDWAKAADVLCSLWLRCEQNLPRCHPTTICAMLDLAGALTKTKNTESAKFIISQALDLFASYLSEVESLFYDRRYFELYCKDPNRTRVVFFDDCVDAVGIMEAFSKKFHQDLSREFLEHLGSKHPIALLNHSLVADSFLVLANCLSSGEEMEESKEPGSARRNRERSNSGSPQSRYFWSLALSQYDLALRGWISIESIIHPNAASVTFSIARCLRELGKLKQALKLLETLASCLERKLDEEILETKKKSKNSSTTFSPVKGGRESSSNGRPSFISPRRLSSGSASSARDVTSTESCEREQTAAVCFWMMAVLTAELNPDELGRNRALSLLHTASLTLQRVLSKHKSGNRLDDQTYQVCLDLYEQIEGEALDLFEPLERIPQVKDFETKEETIIDTIGSPRKKRAPWEVLTPMRQKREWMSPRARIHRDRAQLVSEASADNLFA